MEQKKNQVAPPNITSTTNLQDGRIGPLPANINVMNPIPQPNAASITAVTRKNGRISGYQLSNGEIISKEQGIAMAKAGGIKGVGVASRKGNEYLRTLPDNWETNNLSSLPTITQ